MAQHFKNSHYALQVVLEFVRRDIFQFPNHQQPLDSIRNGLKDLEFYISNHPVLFRSLAEKTVRFMARLIYEAASRNSSDNSHHIIGGLKEVYNSIIYNKKLFWIDLFSVLFKSHYNVTRASYKSEYRGESEWTESLQNRILEGLWFCIHHFRSEMLQSLEIERRKQCATTIANEIEDSSHMDSWFYLILSHCYLDVIHNDLSQMINPKYKHYSLFDACSEQSGLIVFYLDAFDSQTKSEMIEKSARIITNHQLVLLSPSEQLPISSFSPSSKTCLHFKQLLKVVRELPDQQGSEINILPQFASQNHFNMIEVFTHTAKEIHQMFVPSVQFFTTQVLQQIPDSTTNQEFELLNESEAVTYIKNLVRILAAFLKSVPFSDDSIRPMWECIIELYSVTCPSIPHIIQTYLFQELPLSLLIRIFSIFKHQGVYFFNEQTRHFTFSNEFKSVNFRIVEDLCISMFMHVLNSTTGKEYLTDIVSVFRVCNKTVFRGFLSKLCLGITSDIYKHSKHPDISSLVASVTISKNADNPVNTLIQFLSRGSNEEQSFIDVLDHMMQMSGGTSVMSRFVIHSCFYWATVLHYSGTAK